jgi:hypothetical protein
MAQRWAGIKVEGGKAKLVVITFDDDDSVQVDDDHTINMQNGSDRPSAYKMMYQTVLNYLREHNVDFVAIRGSETNRAGTTLAHLEAAELRGIVIAAASAAVKEVKILKKASMSRTFGKRKVDEYLEDDDFWDKKLDSNGIRKGSREAALLVFAARK